jgi:hypothetical protein
MLDASDVPARSLALGETLLSKGFRPLFYKTKPFKKNAQLAAQIGRLKKA